MTRGRWWEFAKDPWRLKATMRAKLVGDEGEELESDEEKASYLAKRNLQVGRGAGGSEALL